MNESIIAGITNFFMACPLLRDGVFRVNALGDQAIEYNIETGVFNPILKKYVNGDTLRQYQFNFVSREYYDMDRIQNIQNSEFYEQFAEWVEEQESLGNFPELPEGCEPDSLSVLSSGYIMDISMRNARYQIQLQLIYYKEAKKHE